MRDFPALSEADLVEVSAAFTRLGISKDLSTKQLLLTPSDMDRLKSTMASTFICSFVWTVERTYCGQVNVSRLFEFVFTLT